MSTADAGDFRAPRPTPTSLRKIHMKFDAQLRSDIVAGSAPCVTNVIDSLVIEP
jgi:hypothetical protein